MDWKVTPLFNGWYGLSIYHINGDAWEGIKQFNHWPTILEIKEALGIKHIDL